RSLGEALGELSTYDNHPADTGDELFERSKDLGLRAHARRRIEAIDLALARMRRGDYGRCTRCGGPIPAARLEADPAAERCARCQASWEEEQAAGPPGPDG